MTSGTRPWNARITNGLSQLKPLEQPFAFGNLPAMMTKKNCKCRTSLNLHRPRQPPSWLCSKMLLLLVTLRAEFQEKDEEVERELEVPLLLRFGHFASLGFQLVTLAEQLAQILFSRIEFSDCADKVIAVGVERIVDARKGLLESAVFVPLPAFQRNVVLAKPKKGLTQVGHL